MCGVWRGAFGGNGVSAGVHFDFRRRGVGYARVFVGALSLIDGRERLSMQIVVVRSPKFFRGILRRMFGIKRQDYIE